MKSKPGVAFKPVVIFAGRAISQVWRIGLMSDFIILALALLSSSVLLLLAYKNKHNPSVPQILLFALCTAAAAAVNFYLYRAKTGDPLLWQGFDFLAIILAFTTILTFVIANNNREKWLTTPVIAGLAVIPITGVIFILSNLRFSNLSFRSVISGGYPALALEGWIAASTIYVNILILIAVILLAIDFKFEAQWKRNRTTYFLTGIAVSLLVNNNFFTGAIIPRSTISIISLVVCSIGFILGFVIASPVKDTAMERERVVEQMSDGWVVLDGSNRITDINIAAEKMIGTTRQLLIGQMAEKIFMDWPNLMNNLSDAGELDVSGSLRVEDGWTYLNIHISPLMVENNEAGKLVILRDITAQRQVEETRRQARDEMFILLHSITSAASRALNLDDFLSESIYQIVYSSRSQAIAVYLLDEIAPGNRERRLTLAAQHGFPPAFAREMSTIPESLELVKMVLDQLEPFQIKDISQDSRVPEELKAMGSLTLLMIPMALEGQALGFIALTRTGMPAYNPEEIARLSAVTDEVATFVHSNRQRQLSIALAERQRLVHDLHDSVTQQLYGLVVSSEAAKAAVQSGDKEKPFSMILQMADNARQALKEMRLFLYQMQPVDFERDGLETVLRQRLSTVEGRADINARLVFDEDLYLPLEKQLSLYFICQEALNNILKHAKAKNVKIFLKQQKSNITLDIEDDGCGFDTKKTDSGGIGMKSMRARAAQMGGKLKISSSPGSGTRLTVSFKNNGQLRGVSL